MTKIFYTFLLTIFSCINFAYAISQPTQFQSTDEILAYKPDNTECATAVLTDALSDMGTALSETDHETVVREWIYQRFYDADVLRQVLSCPEIANAADDAVIKFLPIEYTFPGGRKISINYETQPRVLKQHLLIAGKRDIPTATDDNPRIGALNDATVWVNLDPAWYGILVVESGTLDQFVGPGKNNTISLKYIEENIDTIYPRGISCTSKSAIAADSDLINRAVTKTVGIKEATGEDDSNDYYVAGDVNLEWISYAEIALDVVISVVTFGGGAVVLGATKAARAARATKTLGTSLRALSKVDTVRDWVRISAQHRRALEELKSIDRATDAAKYADKEREIAKLSDSLKNLEQSEDVKKYSEQAKMYGELNKYRNQLRGVKLAKRGNVAVRAWRGLRAANTGGKMLNRGAKMARSSTKSGRIRDWLFNSTMRNAGRLAKMEEAGGLLYGILKFGGDMYDWTTDTTGEYTNNIQFKPLGLLSADDIQGAENVVNYGMWLMWAGDSASAADDDAAYLQAMDFAAKFHQDLMEVATETGNEFNVDTSAITSQCQVDIFVVRPIVRNPGTNDEMLYYLIMNDEPWTTTQ